MDIEEYIDNIVSYLFFCGIYDAENNDERKRIYDKVRKIKLVCNIDDEYKNMSFEEKKKVVDTLLEDILVKNSSQRENLDEIHKNHSIISGVDFFGKTLLEKQSLTSDELLEIAYCTIGSGSLHLHCGISRKIDYIDHDGKEITHFHNLLRRLKSQLSVKYDITDKSEIERLCSEEVIRPYIIEVLTNAVSLTVKYPNLKTIRLDTNDKFFELIYPIFKELGFVTLDEHDEFHMRELEDEIKWKCSIGDERFMKYKDYKFPDDLEKFYMYEPDRKKSVTIHSETLRINLEKLRQENYSI